MAIATNDGGSVCRGWQAVSGYREENETFCYWQSPNTMFIQEEVYSRRGLFKKRFIQEEVYSRRGLFKKKFIQES